MAVATVLVACGGPTAPTAPSPPPPPPPVPSNTAPTISAISASSERAEISDRVSISATVSDAETPVDQLTYEWSADRGVVSGQGATASWTGKPGDETPGVVTIQLTVIEKLAAPAPDGQTENRVSASVAFHENDSVTEVTGLTMTFLGDFANSSTSPEYCVRNFSDTCGGKRDELSDITNNRILYTILGSKFSVSQILFDAPRTWANITAPCEFISLIKADGSVGTARGTCLLTATYQSWRWNLCDSHFRAADAASLRFRFIL